MSTTPLGRTSRVGPVAGAAAPVLEALAQPASTAPSATSASHPSRERPLIRESLSQRSLRHLSTPRGVLPSSTDLPGGDRDANTEQDGQHGGVDPGLDQHLLGEPDVVQHAETT